MIRITQLIIAFATIQVTLSLNGLQTLLSTKGFAAQLPAQLPMFPKQLPFPAFPVQLPAFPVQLPAVSNPVIGSSAALPLLSSNFLRRRNVVLNPLSNNNVLVNVGLNRAILNPVLRSLNANLLNPRLLLNTGLNNQMFLNRGLNLAPNIQSSQVLLGSGINTGSILNTGLNRLLLNQGLNLGSVANIPSRRLLLSSGLVSRSLLNHNLAQVLNTRALLNTGGLSTGTLLNTDLNTLGGLRTSAILQDAGISVGLGETLMDGIDDIGITGTRILHGI